MCAVSLLCCTKTGSAASKQAALRQNVQQFAKRCMKRCSNLGKNVKNQHFRPVTVTATFHLRIVLSWSKLPRILTSTLAQFCPELLSSVKLSPVFSTRTAETVTSSNSTVKTGSNREKQTKLAESEEIQEKSVYDSISSILKNKLKHTLTS